MAERFADVPSALANSVEIAKRCNLTLELDKPRLPDFPTPEGITLDDYMVRLAEEGLEKRMVQLFPDEAERQANHAQYQERLHRSEEHTSELQSLMRISYAVFCLKKKK